MTPVPPPLYPPAMPSQARLDAPDTLHQGMGRGLERRAIFQEDADRANFVARLAAVAEAGALTAYAWALPPNHVRLLVRTGMRPLARSLRNLLTDSAGALLRWYHRVNHRFRNRLHADCSTPEGIAYLWTTVLRHPGPPRPPLLGVSAPRPSPKRLRRGRADRRLASSVR